MDESIDKNKSYFRIFISGEIEGLPTLLDTTNFLTNINIVYLTSRISTDPNYQNISYFEALLESEETKIRPEDQLLVYELKKQSPLELIAVVAAVPAAVGAIWGLVQIAEKVINFSLNRRKLLAEIEKLERENKEARNSQPLIEEPEATERIKLFIDRQQARWIYDQAVERLTSGPIKILEVEVSIVKGRLLLSKGKPKPRKKSKLARKDA